MTYEGNKIYPYILAITVIVIFQYLSPGSPFYSQNYLGYLSLQNNRIKHLDTPDCFEGLHSLKALDLSGNQLAILRAEIDVFREVPNLEKLDLSNNQISWVAPDVFSPLQSLINLELSSNKLLGSQQNISRIK